MIANITNYFTNLNSAGQALFIVGVLLVITFIILLVIVLKPEKNKVKKIYGESAITDRENIFEEKMKDIDNIGIDDINIENDKTRNLKNIVDELKHLESKNAPTVMDKIEAYEDEQEDTAIISVEELFKANNQPSYSSNSYANNNLENTQVFEREFLNKPLVQANEEQVHFAKEEIKEELPDYLKMEEVKPIVQEREVIVEEKKIEPRREIFSSVFAEPQSGDQSNEVFLQNLKEFRNNL